MTEHDLPPSDGAAPLAPLDAVPAPAPQRGETFGLGDDAGLLIHPSGDVPLDGELPPGEGELAAAPPPDAPKRPSYLFLAIVSTLSVVADIGTKVWAEKTLVIGAAEVPAPKVIIKGVLTFFLAKNRGGAWGFLQHQPEKVRKPFFVLVSVLAIALLVGLYRRVHPEQKALKWGLPLVFGGAVGNLVDRIRYGHVIDFIDVQATYKGMAHHWPTFNVADIAICVGVALMAVDMFTPRRESPAGDPLAPPVGEGDAATEPSVELPLSGEGSPEQSGVDPTADDPARPLPPAV